MTHPYHLIDLEQSLPGQRRFISCWAQPGPGCSFIVDPGPPASGPKLISALEDIGLKSLDFILLTHIHLDHGGTTAMVLKRWPEARVVCHPRGRRHLVDPTRLWEGSLAVLGEKAEVYGRPLPVSEDSLAPYEEAAEAQIQVIETPGHAPHHICFAVGEDLFLGEAAGTFSTLGRGEDTPEPYLRPATPPVFQKEVAMASLGALLDLEPFPRRLFFAHHGMYGGDGRGLLTAARDQLGLWVDVARSEGERRGSLPAEGNVAQEEDWMAAVSAALAGCDPYFGRGSFLPPDIRERERDFTRQSLRGILGYLRR